MEEAAAGGGPSESGSGRSSRSSRRGSRMNMLKMRKGKSERGRTANVGRDPITLNINRGDGGTRDGSSAGELGFAALNQQRDISGEVQAINAFKDSIRSAKSPLGTEGIQFFAPATCRRVLFEAAAKLVGVAKRRKSAMDAKEVLSESEDKRDSLIAGIANANLQLKSIELQLTDLQTELAANEVKQIETVEPAQKMMLEIAKEKILEKMEDVRSVPDKFTKIELVVQRELKERSLAEIEEEILVQERALPITLDKTIQFCLSLNSPANYNFTDKQAEEIIDILRTSGGALPKVTPTKGCISTEIVSNVSTDAITDEKKVLEAIHETFALKIVQNEGFTAAEGMLKDIDAMVGRMTKRVKQLSVKELKTQGAKKEALLSRANLVRADNPLITIIHNLNLIVGAELDVPTVTNIIGVPVCGATKTIYDEWVRRRGGSTLTSQDLFDLFEPDLSNAQLRFNNTSLVKEQKEEKDDEET